RPPESLADRITIWYSPTANLARILTPSGSAVLSSASESVFILLLAPPSPLLGYRGAHGSCSQYSTRRGADSSSMCRNPSGGNVLTCSFCSTTGTGTTIAKFSGGPL